MEKGKNSLSYIDLKDRKITLKAKSDSGWFEERTNIKYRDEEPIEFTITPYLLKGILSETHSCILAEDKMKFEGAGWIYVMALRK